MTTLTTLESFTGGADGGGPGYGSLLMDGNGDLFGTTLWGGTGGGGTVFELVHTGSGYTFETLVSFDANNTNQIDGNTPFAGLTADSHGNLFGVTQAGGSANSGTVFELVNTGSGYNFQTLASFSGGTAGSGPMGTLLADANGDLFGTTQSGGALGEGTVFELVHTASGYGSPVTLAEFNYTDGASPTGPLIADANGDLFGTTQSGGPGGDGTVFELAHSASGYGSPITLASFDGSNGSLIYAGVTADAQGDLFGAAYMGGQSGYGVVYELVNNGSGFSAPVILAQLDGANTGGYVIGGLTVDAQGDVFGTAETGGAGGFGTVFELVHSGSGYTFQLLDSFTGGADGALPEAGLTVDGAGNLYGATAGGGADGAGTVFEIGSAAPNDGGAAEQAALALRVNGGSGNPIGPAGEAAVAITVLGLQSGDTGVVTFTDSANHTVTVDVSGSQTHYTVDLTGLVDGAVTSSLQVATNSVGDVFTPVAGNGVTLDTVAPAQPGAPADAAVSNGLVNAAGDVSTQTIGGMAEAGSAVAVYDNGTMVATVIADNSGAWSYEIGVLANGTSHSYAVTATDAAGNTSPMSAALSFTVEAAAPTQPAAPSDAGASNGYVNAAHDTAAQAITGTTQAGATVAVYDNGTEVATVTADGTGAWSYQVGALADGSTHSYAVTATDAAGNTSPMGAALNFTVDVSAPAQPAAPSDAAVSKGWVNAAHDTAAQALTGSAEAGATVAVYDNGTQVATVTADGTGAWSYQVGALADGSTHSYAVTATDAAGNTSPMSAALGFTVDTSAPAKSAAPSDPGVSNGLENAAHDTSAQTVTGVTEAGASVAIYDNGALVKTVTADGSGAWSWQVGVLTDTSVHNYAFTATDAAGNTSAMSGVLSFAVDATPPGQPAAPADAAVSNGWVNAVHDTSAQAISGTVEGGATVTVYDNGTQVATVAADNSGAWSFQVGALADGSAHSYAVTATDAAGNVSLKSAALSFKVDTTAPVQPGTPTDAAVSNGYVNAAHNGTGQSLTGVTEAGASVAISDNNALVATVTANASGAWSYQIGTLTDGSMHSYAVTAADAAGNVSPVSAALDFTVDASAPAAPLALSDAAITNGWVNGVSDTSGQTLTGTAEGGALVTVYDNGAKIGTATAAASGAWVYTLGHMADGVHGLTATATDAAGNTGAYSTALTFTVDTVIPDPDVLAATVGGDGVTTVSGTAETGTTVTLYDGSSLVGTAPVESNGNWSYAVGVLANGSSHSYAVTATDAAGNVSPESSALSFTVGATPPAKPSEPTDASAHNGWVNAAGDTAAQTIGGTADAGALVTIFDHGIQVATAIADSSGVWSWKVGVLADGSAHSYAVTATDSSGLTSAMSDALAFTVDTTAPGAPTGLTDAAILGGIVNQARDTAGQMVTGKAEAGALVTIFDNGTKLGTVIANAVTGAWSLALGVLIDGAHSLTATAADAAGNVSAPSAALGFTVDATPPVPVVENVTSAAKGYSVVSGVSEANSSVTLYDGGQQIGMATADSFGNWSVTAKLNGGSVHEFTETAQDQAGNIGGSTGSAYWANPANKAFVGGAGDDVFIGQKGDTFTGGSGHNHFVFDVGFGTQTVTNFRHGSDQVWFDQTLFGTASQAVAHAHQSGANTVILDSAGDQLILQNVQASTLQAGDFHLF
jgi:uncharacterized repeat protein (TIGR03803 family)